MSELIYSVQSIENDNNDKPETNQVVEARLERRRLAAQTEYYRKLADQKDPYFISH